MNITIRNPIVAALGVLTLSLALTIPVDAADTVLHSFTGSATDGSTCYSALVLSGSTFYGTTARGGSANRGTVYAIEVDGTNFRLLHSFAGGASDGSFGVGSLTLDGSSLYGMTQAGGLNDAGTIYRINTNGTGFTLLRSFAGGDEIAPGGALTLSGARLYGMTAGAFGSRGTIFGINTNGTGFASLHVFAGGPSDGQNPILGAVTLIGTKLYGMTQRGGSAEDGVIFSLNTDGTEYTVLHNFGAPLPGTNPLGSLIVFNSRLYGIAQGSFENNAIIFGIDPDGSDFSVVHSFPLPSSGSGRVFGSLVVSDSKFYGTTSGDAAAGGIVFRINPDGTNFVVLHSFTGAPTDGASPYGDLVVAGSRIYGTTEDGGSNDVGTIFSVYGGPLRVTDISRSGTAIVIQFAEAFVGRTYRLERKNSLSAMWDSNGISDLTPIMNGTGQFTDPGAISLGRAFYRVRVLP